ncbi:MAG: AzlC family ABC transporter permease [Ilumatobacteraceae bacterium]
MSTPFVGHHGAVHDAGEVTEPRPGRPIGNLLPPIARSGWDAGMRDMMPLAIPIAIWGLVTGVAMVNTGIGVWAALLITATVFAGAAQLATVPLIVAGTPLVIVWVTAALVNLRFVIFSAASRRTFIALPLRQRLVASYLNGDIGFALFTQRYGTAEQRGTPEQYGYFFATATVNWASWQISSVAGILLGGLAPTEWGLDIAASLAIIAVLVPMAARAPAITGVVVAAAVSVATNRWPMRSGLVVAVLAGVVVAISAEHLAARRTT